MIDDLSQVVDEIEGRSWLVRLTSSPAVAVKGIDRKGMYHDGGGLYLQVSAGGAKSWIFRFMLDGRSREMGLGPVHAIPLADARKRAAECRRMRFDGIDPIEVRRAQRDQKKLDAAKSMTFDALRRGLYRCA